jgi:ketosteroid isomerase-like protein
MWHIFRVGGILAALVASGALYAQETQDDQAAVWAIVEQAWIATERGDANWVDEMLLADFVGWPAQSPAPRNKASTRMWARYDGGSSEGLVHELYPLSIVVHGDVAVVHYLYTSAVQNRDKESVVRNGRFTDVLARDDGGWKFIAWHGGHDAP